MLWLSATGTEPLDAEIGGLLEGCSVHLFIRAQGLIRALYSVGEELNRGRNATLCRNTRLVITNGRHAPLASVRRPGLSGRRPPGPGRRSRDHLGHLHAPRKHGLSRIRATMGPRRIGGRN
jgi:hypothetical protein